MELEVLGVAIAVLTTEESLMVVVVVVVATVAFRVDFAPLAAAELHRSAVTS